MTKPLAVTDHAIVRYLERVLGMDIDDLKAAIATPELAAIAAKLGDGYYPVAEGLWAVVRGGCIITISKKPTGFYHRKGKGHS